MLALLVLNACSHPRYNYEQSEQRATHFYNSHQDSLAALVHLYRQQPAFYVRFDDDLMTLWQYDLQRGGQNKQLFDMPLHDPKAQAAFKHLRWTPIYFRRLQQLLLSVQATQLKLVPDMDRNLSPPVEVRCLIDEELWVKYKVYSRELTPEDTVWFTTYLKGRQLGGIVDHHTIWYFCEPSGC